MRNKLVKSLVAAFVGSLLISGSAMALPLLSELKDDDRVTPVFNYPGAIDDIADSGAEAVRLTDTDGINDTARSALLFTAAGFFDSKYLQFGIYDFTDNSGVITINDTLMLLNSADANSFNNTVNFDLAAGTASASYGSEGVKNIGETFGFYLHNANSQNTFYSHNFKNEDSFDHALIYDTTSIGYGDLHNSDVVVAFEDVFNGGDKDYNDVIIGVSDVAPAPVPEPATMLLFGTGLVGLAGVARKRKKK